MKRRTLLLECECVLWKREHVDCVCLCLWHRSCQTGGPIILCKSEFPCSTSWLCLIKSHLSHITAHQTCLYGQTNLLRIGNYFTFTTQHYNNHNMSAVNVWNKTKIYTSWKLNKNKRHGCSSLKAILHNIYYKRTVQVNKKHHGMQFSVSKLVGCNSKMHYDFLLHSFDGTLIQL